MAKDKYTATIGLEIHAELKTRTKMFCASINDSEEKRPNVNICPVCMGYPGTLPVINKEAVKDILKVGLALGGEVADFTEFDRKNYFYPDIPKGYQISQYKYPLIKGGSLNGVALTRIHLEEDTAKSTHDEGDYSLVDFNRAGVPLMELVTEPVIQDAYEAVSFAKELQLLLKYLGVADANMEKGEMRVEANISVSKTDDFGTKVEVKNLNSFKAVERAIIYEIERHITVLESGRKVVQETRGWDESKQKTFTQRSKEYSHDYRYFPDPDLPKLYISEIPEFAVDKIKKELPELPWEKRARFKKDFGFRDEDIEIFVSNLDLGNIFENVAHRLKDKDLISLASNYVLSDLLGRIKKNPNLNWQENITPVDLYEIIAMLKHGKGGGRFTGISSRGAKDLLAYLFEKGGGIAEAVKATGVMQISDEDMLKKIAEEVIKENEKVAAEYKAGKTASLQFLIGQGMKKSKGSANPGILKRLFEETLK